MNADSKLFNQHILENVLYHLVGAYELQVVVNTYDTVILRLQVQACLRSGTLLLICLAYLAGIPSVKVIAVVTPFGDGKKSRLRE